MAFERHVPRLDMYFRQLRGPQEIVARTGPLEACKNRAMNRALSAGDALTATRALRDEWRSPEGVLVRLTASCPSQRPRDTHGNSPVITRQTSRDEEGEVGDVLEFMATVPIVLVAFGVV